MKEGACWHLSRGSISQAAHSEYKQVISFDVICKCRLAVAITPTLIFVPRIFVIARAYQSDVAWGHNAISRSRTIRPRVPRLSRRAPPWPCVVALPVTTDRTVRQSLPTSRPIEA